MDVVNNKILEIDRVICQNISKFDNSERGLLSQNILAQLRNLVEHVSLRVFFGGKQVESYNYDDIQNANSLVKSKGDLRFLSKFHSLLQKTTSHYTLNEENSERLMLKYYEYLLKIRTFLQAKYGISILANIDDFPLHIDTALYEFHEKIANRIECIPTSHIGEVRPIRYYVQKVKPFFVNYEVFYEVTITIANDKISKFDRIVLFTKLDIPRNYSVKLSILEDSVSIFGKQMPIQLICAWEMSIRPCELNNFMRIFGNSTKLTSEHTEYKRMMSFLVRTGLDLAEIVEFDDDNYNVAKTEIVSGVKATHFMDVLDICRDITKERKSGANIVKYLLFTLNNRILKNQYSYDRCSKLSNLYLQNGCIPFDEMPFNTSLIGHNPRFHDLFECLSLANREHELLARHIRNNIEIHGNLYTSLQEVEHFENVSELIQSYNTKLYRTHMNRRLEIYKNHVYVKGYEDDVYNIIGKLTSISSCGLGNYHNFVDSWIRNSSYSIDCDEKKSIIYEMFDKSKVAFIYGSAGTGKSTIINHVSNLFNKNSKLYLANTNPAVDNMIRKISSSNCTFMTISKFLSSGYVNTMYDLLVIDECSTVSNSDMIKILEKVTFEILVLVGDTFQIESILFGNWFELSQSIISENARFELTKPYRSENPNLLEFWAKVRNMSGNDDVLEYITKNDYSTRLDETVFNHIDDDEIILCLNYDGLYGINNINKFLQASNEGFAVQRGVSTYKVNDPILFNDSERFAPLIYNNLKGVIVGIDIVESKVQFDIKIDKVINQLDADRYEIVLLESDDEDKSVIRFLVDEFISADDDEDEPANSIVPFQVAYAVSIHKAQGLEYNSVKIIITNEVEEMISHNIFYTAVTRAKKRLKIYWSPETESKTLKALKRRDGRKDAALLTQKYSI